MHACNAWKIRVDREVAFLRFCGLTEDAFTWAAVSESGRTIELSIKRKRR